LPFHRLDPLFGGPSLDVKDYTTDTHVDESHGRRLQPPRLAPAHPPSTRRAIPRSGDRVYGGHHDIHAQAETDAFPDRKEN